MFSLRVIFYFYFNPQHTHHSWLTHSGNKGPRRDAPRSFVAVDERFFPSSVRGSLSKADAFAMLNMRCLVQLSQGSQAACLLPSLPHPPAAARLYPLHSALNFIPLTGLMIFCASKT